MVPNLAHVKRRSAEHPINGRLETLNHNTVGTLMSTSARRQCGAGRREVAPIAIVPLRTDPNGGLNNALAADLLAAVAGEGGAAAHQDGDSRSQDGRSLAHRIHNFFSPRCEQLGRCARRSNLTTFGHDDPQPWQVKCNIVDQELERYSLVHLKAD